MLGIRAVADLSIGLYPVPHRQPFVINQLLAALAVGAPGSGIDAFDDLLQAVADDRRELRRGFLDVDLPVGIHAVGNVDPDTRQLRQFRLAAQAEPGAVKDQPLASIQVEPLRFQVSFRPADILPIRLRHLLVMRKGKALDLHVAPDQGQLLFGVCDGSRVLSGKGIERAQQSPVQQHPKRLRLFHEPMEDEAEVAFGFRNSLIDHLGTLGSIV